MSFLNQEEINRMISDFDTLLDSPETPTVILIWDEDGTYNSAYDKWTGATEKTKEDVSAMVNIISETDLEEVGGTNIKAGDILFYFSNTEDLDKRNLKIRFKVIDYKPVLPQPILAEDFLVPLGNSQMAQVILARRLV